jgi:CHAT domain-containing protein
MAPRKDFFPWGFLLKKRGVIAIFEGGILLRCGLLLPVHFICPNFSLKICYFGLQSMCMKRLLLLFLFPFFLPSLAQINLGTLKNMVDSEIGKKVKDIMLDRLEDMRSDYDEASFNYAVSLSDNAGLFESEERFTKNKRMMLDFFAATQGKEVTREDSVLSLNSIGEMMYASNKYSAAETSFMQAKKMLENANDSSDALYAQIISNLGLLYHTTGRYTLAEKWAWKAKTLREKILGLNTTVYASSLNNLAVLYKDMGRYNEAEANIKEAVETIQKTAGKESVPYALSLNNQAMIFYTVGRAESAQFLLKQALNIAGKTLKDKSTNYVRLLINLALMYQDLGKYKEAEDIYLKAIKIKESKLSTHHPDYAHLLDNLASLYLQMGKTKEVEANLKKAAEIYKKKLGEKHPAYAGTISNLGNFYRVSNRTSEAEPLLNQALSIRKESLGENHPDYISSLESVGLLYWKTGKIPESVSLLKSVTSKSLELINRYFSTLSEAEKAKLWEKTQPKFLRFYAFSVSEAAKYPNLLVDMYNYQLATKALLLNATNRIKNQILESNDVKLKAKYSQWLDQKEELAHVYTLSKEELKEEKINIDSLERLANQLEKELSASSNLFSQGYIQKTIQVQDITAALTTEDAAVEIIQLNKFDNVLTDSVYYAALILSKENPSQPKLVLNKQGNDLNKKYYSYYRNSIHQLQADEYSYGKFWQPIQMEIKSKRTVYISLDGVYSQINLNTLQQPDGRYVIDDKDIILVTNSKEILGLKKAASAKTNPNTATLIGFPEYGTKGTLDKLPGTQKELASIKSLLAAKQYKINYLIKTDASEENVKEMKPSKILHIATHGFFMPEPEQESEEKVFGIASSKSKENPMLRAGLLLANAEAAIAGQSENGILTAYEVSNLQLSGNEMVTLSACETGLGDVKNGEGVYGLQRAFQVAGSETIVMSLWKVSDEATQLLMSSFYKNYMQSGNKQKAFKQAQAELKSKWKEPYYWGAFVMVE